MSYETPSSPCPYCGADCEADWCDVGVGMVQAGPYHCENCHASEAGSFEDFEAREDYDPSFGWYRPESPPGSTANVHPVTGRHIDWKEADTLYRAANGVAPRY